MELIHKNAFRTAAYGREKGLVYAEYMGIINLPLGLEILLP